MAIEVTRYTQDLTDAVKDLNVRLRSIGKEAPQFPESPIPRWLPQNGNRRLYQEYFLALEGTSIARGGFILKHQDFSFGGEILSMACYRYPLSEGIADKKYGSVGLQLLLAALRKQPLLFALGMGGYEEPLPRMLKAMGWRLCPVPFYFKVNRPKRFLKNIRPLRGTRVKRVASDVLANTGLGWATLKFLQARVHPDGLRRIIVASAEVAERFDTWSDDLWHKTKASYALIAVRNSDDLNTLYPAQNRRFIRLKVLKDSQAIGWAVVLDTQMSGHKYFGDMRVGSMIDCLASPEHSPEVAQAATDFLERRGVDVIVSNQSHPAWCLALKRDGFIQARSNFIFAASRQLAERLGSVDLKSMGIHMNRGDGDGPIHL